MDYAGEKSIARKLVLQAGKLSLWDSGAARLEFEKGNQDIVTKSTSKSRSFCARNWKKNFL